MRSVRTLVVVLCALVASASALAQPLTTKHFAGPAGGLGSDDGTGAEARFNAPRGIAVDAAGNFYVTEYGNLAIRKVSPQGQVTSLIGNPINPQKFGVRSGPTSFTQITYPWGAAIDAAGAMYVAMERQNLIRKILPDGSTFVVAGVDVYGGGTADGQGSAARFYSPRGIALGPDGNLYIADCNNHTIRRMTPDGVVTTLAGLARQAGSADGTGSGARFNWPEEIAVDGNGNIFVADYNNYVRKITPAGVVTTIPKYIYNVTALAVDASGTLWVGESGAISRLSANGTLTRIAGDGYAAAADGIGTAAEVSPTAMQFASNGDLYFTDANHAVRKMTPSAVVTTVAGLPTLPTWRGTVDGVGLSATFNSPGAAAVDSLGNLFVVDGGSTIRKITAAGEVTTFAGSSYGFADGPVRDAKFGLITQMVFDANDDLYLADHNNYVIRKISGGIVTTIAGSPGLSGTADGVGTGARFDEPQGITIDSAGNLFVTDRYISVIRKVTPAGVVSTFAGVAGARGYVNGTGSAARFDLPDAISIDSADNLYVHDRNNFRIRKVTPTGVVTTFAGSGSLDNVDGTGSGASFYQVRAISPLRNGLFYLTDDTAVRTMTLAGTVVTVAGSHGVYRGVDYGFGSQDGTGAFARFSNDNSWGLGVAADTNGNVYITDSSQRNIRRARLASGEVAVVDSATGLVGQTRYLDVTGGSADTFFWSIIRQPVGSTATLSNATIKNPTFTPDVADTYRFRVVASGPNGSSITEVELSADCNDFVPVPSSSLNPSCVNQLVTLDAGQGTAYRWSTGETTRTISVAPSGYTLYSGTVWDASGCPHGFAIAQDAQSDLSSSSFIQGFGSGGCMYAPVTFTASPYGGGTKAYQWGYRTTSGGPITPIQGATEQSYSLDYTIFNQPVSYYLTCTVTPQCGTPKTDERFISLLPAINPVVTVSGPTTFCAGGSVTLTAPAGAASYLWSNGATTQSITVSTSGDYSVRLSNSQCYSYSAVTSITVLPLPAAPAITTSGPTTFCEGGSVTLTASEGASYLWSNGATTRSITVSTSGAFSVAVPGASGCSATSAPTIVTVNPLPIATVTPSGPTTFCAGSNVTLTAAAAASYLWSNGATSQSITVSESGSYSVVVTSANGCSTTSTPTVVTVNAPPATPTIVAGGPTTFCQGGSVTLTASPGASYHWSTGATTQAISVNATGSYSVTVGDVNGCSATSAPTIVTANALPTATITPSGATTFCEGGSVTLTASAGTAYVWSNGATTPSVTVSTSGNYSVTVSNAEGCSATSAPVAVIVAPLPTPTITASGPTTFCEGGSVTLTAPAGMTAYEWSNGATSPSITVSAPGIYSVTVTNASGCSATSASTAVNVNTVPTATISASGPTTFCEGGSVTLTAPAGMNSYTWSNGATTPSITVNASGSYAVTVTNASGCSMTSAAQTIVVNADPPVPAIEASGPTTFCDGGSVVLTAPIASTYAWSNGATTRSITVATTGVYSVTVTNANGCSASSAPLVVTVNANPTASITANGPTTFCEGGSVTLTSSAGSGYLWSNGATTQSITVNASGTYAVTVTNGSGCSTTSAGTQVTVNPNPPTPTITAGGPTTFCQGGSVTLTAPASSSYLWSNGQTTQSITVNASESYAVTVTNASGCSATSAPTVVTVNPATLVTKDPQSVTITRNTTTTLSVTATGTGTLSYQWYNGATGNTSKRVGTNSPSFTTPKLTKGTYQYWVRVTGACGTDDSATATVTAQ